MTRSLLRATTALTLSLSLLQPGFLPAQSLGEALEDLEALEAICADDPDAEGCDELLLLQEEAEPEAEAEPEPEVEPEPEPEPEPEVAPEPEAEPEVEAEPEADIEAEAEDLIEEPADAPAEAAAEEPEAAPEADVAEEVIETPVEDSAEDTAESPLDALPDEDAVVEEAEAESEAPVELEAEAEAEAESEAEIVTETEEPVDSEAESAAEAEAEAEAETATEAEAAEADAEVVVEESAPVTEEDLDASATLLEDPEVAAAAETLMQALSAAESDDAATDDADAPLAGAAAALAAMLAGESGAEAEAGAEPTEVEEIELTEETTRSSAEEFATGLTAQVDTSRSRDSGRGLSDLERAGLVALGGLAVGLIMSNGNRVVASSGDRVVVDRGDGNLAIWKDDDALLRQPGANQRIERYADGSTITRLDRADGTQIVTIRDATGRVLRRARVEVDGSQTLLIDDTQRFQPVEVSQLPRPRTSEVRITEGSDPELIRALLQAAEQPEIGRSFSLRQVRETQPLRELAPEISADPILFATGSSAVRADEARKLLRLGRLMQDLIADNPREVFLIEGHTDATGPASFNLALSDRRAESVALALSEYFGVPPENMVVQGYGEDHLKIPTLEAEPQNRRVAVRRVTWLLAQR